MNHLPYNGRKEQSNQPRWHFGSIVGFYAYALAFAILAGLAA